MSDTGSPALEPRTLELRGRDEAVAAWVARP